MMGHRIGNQFGHEMDKQSPNVRRNDTMRRPPYNHPSENTDEESALDYMDSRARKRNSEFGRDERSARVARKYTLFTVSLRILIPKSRSRVSIE